MTLLVVSVSCLAWPLAQPACGVTFTTDTLIDAGDTTFDNQDILVQGCTLTANGSISATGSAHPGGEFRQVDAPPSSPET